MLFSSLVASLSLSALALAVPTPRDNWHGEKHSGLTLFKFTSTYAAYATPDQVVNNSNVATPGEPGAWGWFKYGINAPEEIICYNISVFISGNYSSPALTATHIHQGPYGRAGPPRIAFPNPTIDSSVDEQGLRSSIGCLKGPFTTGVLANGTDTGTGFSLAQIEADPPAFFTDVHTSQFTAGAIRGQLDLTGSVY
ncbi:hypothetical protein T439DRAFT_322259 [Meredithblackwellia eburnea MCA 4105]